MIVSFHTGLTAGDSISPERGEVSEREGQSVTLRCTYETTNTYIYLYWYRHHSDLQTPQFILYKGEGTQKGDDHIPDKRYESETTDKSTELTINRLTLADTGLYYCSILIIETTPQIHQLMNENITLY
uniref:T-cell receptor alpha/delta variable 26.0 n=1 Tax=Lates calcarifer TaxID=8187 RepID=A0A4W6C9K3_LATCA